MRFGALVKSMHPNNLFSLMGRLGHPQISLGEGAAWAYVRVAGQVSPLETAVVAVWCIRLPWDTAPFVLLEDN